MSATVLMDSMMESSPRSRAGITGVICLMNTLAFVPVAWAHGRFAADEMLAHESLFRLAFMLDVIAVASYIAVTALFFDLFSPVSRRLSTLAALVSAIGCAVASVSCLLAVIPSALWRAAQYLPGFPAAPLRALTLLFFRLRAQTVDFAIVFFGLHCLLIGWLIYRSGFLPRALGVLMAIAGAGWLTYLSPSLAHHLSPLNSLISGFLGQGSLTLWLLLIGVSARRRSGRVVSEASR